MVLAGHRRGDRDFVQAFERRVDRGEVLLDDGLPLGLVGFLDRLLDLADRLVPRQHAGQREEARLHDRVDAALQAHLARHRGGVDHVHLQLLLDDLFLDLSGKMIPHFVLAVGRGKEEDSPLLEAADHVDLLEKTELVAGDEVGAAPRDGARLAVTDEDS